MCPDLFRASALSRNGGRLVVGLRGQRQVVVGGGNRLGELDGPEDIILDEDDNLYCGSRHGDVIRFFAPDYKRHEVYVHIGGSRLAWRSIGIRSCGLCRGNGLYKVTKDRKPVKLSDETNRSLFSVIDDSRMRLADDLDIAPDGRIFFSEATIRYEIHDWILDALESRGNGRIICYDPHDGSSRTVLSNLQFPNGITMVGDDESFLFAEPGAVGSVAIGTRARARGRPKS
ncbi:strictosidine synthase family protein [Celeribacter baekdonensis]|uniref:strictosidine synthase family protein n=1 Tax=Celeribacter baekdonensis TaxID=875171 RepID=UPI0026C97286